MSAETIIQWKGNTVLGNTLVTQTPPAGSLMSWWMIDGHPGCGNIPPTTYEIPTNVTPGGIFQTNPAGGKKKWLTSLVCNFATQTVHTTVYDRLLHVSGMNATSTAEQFVDPIGQGYVPLTRYTNGFGTCIFVEFYATIGQVSSLLSVNYLDESGNPRVGSVNMGGGSSFAARTDQCMVRVLLNGGMGVTAIKSCQLAGSTGLAGNFGLTVAHELVYIKAKNGIYSGSVQGFVEVKSNACLFWTAIATNNSYVPSGYAQYTFVDA